MKVEKQVGFQSLGITLGAARRSAFCAAWNEMGREQAMAKKPYVCPVCKGTGKVDARMRDITIITFQEEQCPACKGTCIVWR